MARMPDIEAEAKAAVGWTDHRQASAAQDAPPATRTEPPQEETMPAVPAHASPVHAAQAAIEHAAAMLDQIRSSRLAVALHAEGLGGLLDSEDIHHVVALVRKLEAPHRQAEANVLPRANGNGVRETGPQKQVTG